LFATPINPADVDDNVVAPAMVATAVDESVSDPLARKAMLPALNVAELVPTMGELIVKGAPADAKTALAAVMVLAPTVLPAVTDSVTAETAAETTAVAPLIVSALTEAAPMKFVTPALSVNAPCMTNGPRFTVAHERTAEPLPVNPMDALKTMLPLAVTVDAAGMLNGCVNVKSASTTRLPDSNVSVLNSTGA